MAFQSEALTTVEAFTRIQQFLHATILQGFKENIDSVQNLKISKSHCKDKTVSTPSKYGIISRHI